MVRASKPVQPVQVEKRGLKDVDMESLLGGGMAIIMLDAELYGRVQSLAHRERMYPQEVIAAAIEEYMMEHE